MTTLTIDVADLETVKASMKAAFRGVPQGCRYSFPSEERLLEMLNPNRWTILKALTGADTLGVRELTRRISQICAGKRGITADTPGTAELYSALVSPRR